MGKKFVNFFLCIHKKQPRYQKYQYKISSSENFLWTTCLPDRVLWVDNTVFGEVEEPEDEEAIEDFLELQFPFTSFLVEELLELDDPFKNLVANLKMNTERVIAIIILIVRVISMMFGRQAGSLGGNLLKLHQFLIWNI